jgi:hypothetical protein
VTEGYEDQRGVSMTIATIAGRLDQLVDFRGGQIFAGAQLGNSPAGSELTGFRYAARPSEGA